MQGPASGPRRERGSAPAVITITPADDRVRVSILGWQKLAAGADMITDRMSAARYARMLSDATGFHILTLMARTARHG